MTFGQVLYAIRATCRSWESLLLPRHVATATIFGFAEDVWTWTEGDIKLINDVRLALLSQRPMVSINFSSFAVIEACLLKVHSPIDAAKAAAFDAALLTITPNEVKSSYKVDLLKIYTNEALTDAIEYLSDHEITQQRPPAGVVAQNLLTSALRKSS